ncbi:zf-HC2 domain-containing protein [Amnibacterium kyonggiense]|uniref:Mycothiol system anti-sigma-R factor n=1 Tax=Amnibacterium kyonggiense TaxID=595671 RepID=A0A4R7FIF5_9MICO|nr:zf-HC2 domain-containing protein [Amnibacterium kyonggiense]TDS75881.1 mycothiol system anti-sigma-R factor [Amnibacterium kyonggiense]
MTDCGCEKAKADLEEYLHHELERSEYADISEHLAHCEDCSDEVHLGQVLTDAVKRACRDTAPEELRVQVISSLRLTITH